MARPGRADTLRPIVDWLALLGPTDQWVVSCYLKLEPRDRARGKFRIKLKNRIKGRLAWLEQRGAGASRHDREVVGRDLDRIREHLEHPSNLPAGQGIAIFASELLDLFEVIPLPHVFRSRLLIDHSPQVRELVALDDEFGLVLAVVSDRTSARFFKVAAFGIEELPSLAATASTRAGRFHGTRSAPGPAPGLSAAGEHNYHQRIREEKHRHYALIAQRLFEEARGALVRGIVLGGTGTDAEAVRPHLHPYVARQVLGTRKLNPKTVAPVQVMDAVLELRRESERQWEAEHVCALAEGYGTGWAVNGIEPCLRALGRGQVRTLLVDPTVEQAGFRCARTGQLTTNPAQCGGGGGDGGDPEPVPDVIDEAIEDALRQGSHIDVVEDRDARARVDGLAALLRFKQR